MKFVALIILNFYVLKSETGMAVQPKCRLNYSFLSLEAQLLTLF